MGPLFWWNFWNVVAVVVLAGLVVGMTIWVRRRLRAQRASANSSGGST